MTLREILTKLRADFSTFDANELIIVSYDEKSHELTFSQLNKTVQIPYYGLYYFPMKGFKIGVLTQLGLNRLCAQLDSVLANNLLDDNMYLPRAEKLGTSFYRIFKDRLVPSPVKVHSFKLVNVTNKLATWYLCMHYSDKSRLIYKTMKKGLKS